jgi:transcriptional repressor NrdR
MQIEKLVAEIENQLFSQGDPEVSSQKIGELVVDGLSELSEVAYVRFASVYRRFSDITGFEAELAQIRAKKAAKSAQA